MIYNNMGKIRCSRLTCKSRRLRTGLAAYAPSEKELTLQNKIKKGQAHQNLIFRRYDGNCYRRMKNRLHRHPDVTFREFAPPQELASGIDVFPIFLANFVQSF